MNDPLFLMYIVVCIAGGLSVIMYIVVCIAGGLSVILLYRNNRVLEYRKQVLDKVYYSLVGGGSNLSFDIMKKVSYDDMAIKFWRPLESFFPPEYRI